MRPYLLDLDVDTVDPDGFADANLSSVADISLDGALVTGLDVDGLAASNTTAGASVTLDGALTSGGVYVDATSTPRHITILDAGGDDQSSATYTIIGTSSRGDSLSESLAGPVASTLVVTAGRFASVTSITIASPAAGSTASIGPMGIYNSVDGLAHKFSIQDKGADVQSGSTFTITGLDADGDAQTEALVGPGSGATVTSAKYYKTVSHITQSSPTAGATVDIGTVDEISSKTIPLNYRQSIAATYGAVVTGTIDYTVQETLDEIQTTDNASGAVNWHALSALTAKTASLLAIGTPNVRAARLIVNSHSAAAEIQLTTMQNKSL